MADRDRVVGRADALSMGPWHNVEERSKTHRRSPTDLDAEHCLIRTVRCVSGAVEVAMSCEPRSTTARVEAHWEYDGPGYGEVVARAEGVDVDAADHHRPASRHRGPRARPHDDDRGGRLLRRTVLVAAAAAADHRRSGMTHGAHVRVLAAVDHLGEFPDHPWRSFLQRSALTLKGLTYAPTGAMLAAATTSLPETPRGERNWDYRYAWVRDSTFALWGLYTLGFDREANDFFYFIADGCKDGQDLQIMYGVGGERELAETSLPHLSGYEGAVPVRIGNGAFNQRAARRLGSGARLGLPARAVARAVARALVAGSRSGRSRRPSRTGRSRTAASGRCAASRSTSSPQADVLGGARPRGAAGPTVRGAGVRRQAGQ